MKKTACANRSQINYQRKAEEICCKKKESLSGDVKVIIYVAPEEH